MRNPSHLFAKLLLASFLIMAAFSGGALFLDGLPEATGLLLGRVGTVCAVVQMAAFIVNLVADAAFVRRFKDMKVKAANEQLTALATVIRADHLAARKKLLRLRRVILVYVILMTVTALYGMFTISLSPIPVLNGLCSMYILFQVVLGLPFKSKLDLSGYVSPAAYPALHALAEKARDAIGVKGQVRISFYADGFAGVAKLGKIISLQLDPAMLCLWREEELYAVLIHEMTHLRDADDAAMRYDGFLSLLTADDITVFRYFSYAAKYYAYHAMLYTTLASVVIEQKADRLMAEHASAQTAANALFKIHCYSLFYDDLNYNLGVNAFATETCPPRMLGYFADAFLSKMRHMEENWRRFVPLEIQPKNASHPILRTRLETLGATDFHLTDPETDGDYRAECQKAVLAVDGEIYERRAPSYATQREGAYLKPLATVKAWEEAGKPCEAEDARLVLEALDELCMYDEALHFTTRMIETLTGGQRSHAQYIRGQIRLSRYDDRGIDDLYDALSQNSNYVQEGLDAIGAYCCRVGLADRLEEYRERAADYLQKNIDTQGIDELNPGDDLSEETVLSEEIRARNLAFIVRVGGDMLRQVFLVRKKVTEDCAASAYVLDFIPTAEEKVVNDIMYRVFQYLDSTPEDWQYALFSYTPHTAAALSDLPACLIYKKED